MSQQILEAAEEEIMGKKVEKSIKTRVSYLLYTQSNFFYKIVSSPLIYDLHVILY